MASPRPVSSQRPRPPCFPGDSLRLPSVRLGGGGGGGTSSVFLDAGHRSRMPAGGCSLEGRFSSPHCGLLMNQCNLTKMDFLLSSKGLGGEVVRLAEPSRPCPPSAPTRSASSGISGGPRGPLSLHPSFGGASPSFSGSRFLQPTLPRASAPTVGASGWGRFTDGGRRGTKREHVRQSRRAYCAPSVCRDRHDVVRV